MGCAAWVAGPSQAASPDRVNEQVTPPTKVSGSGVSDSYLPGSPAWASPDGSTLLFTPTLGPGVDFPPRGIGSQPVVAQRGAAGWSSRPAINGPVPDAVISTQYTAFGYQIPSADRSAVVGVAAIPYSADAPVEPTGTLGGGIWLGRGSDVTWVSKPAWTGSSPAPGNLRSWGDFMPIGASADLKTVYFTSRATLTQQDADGGRAPEANWALYRWTNGSLELAGTLPDGSAPRGGSRAANAPQSGANRDNQSYDQRTALTAYANPVASDGSSALFVSPDPLGDNPDGISPQLYLSRAGQPTVLLSKANGQTDSPAGSDGVQGVGRIASSFGNADQNSRGVTAVATPDHRYVLFATVDALTTSAQALPSDERKVYQYDSNTGDVELLPGITWPIDGQYGPVLRMSDDGSRVLYETPTGDLRVWRRGATTLDVGSVPETAPTDQSAIKTVRFAASGRIVVLTSSRPIDQAPGHVQGRDEVYRSDEDDEGGPELHCITCTTVDGSDAAPATFTPTLTETGGPLTDFLATGQVENRGVTDDGSSVFFNTASQLDSADHNGVSDVYEWHDGTTQLLSGGRAGADATSSNAYFLDNSASGNDVFFTTDQGLSADDRDDLVDVYDARVGGGFPKPVQAPQCDGDTCQGTPTPAPTPLSPSSIGVQPPTQGHRDVPAAPVRRFAVGRVTATSAHVTVVVTAPGAGRIRVTGTRVRATTRIVHAGNYNVRSVLTTGARRTLRRAGHVTVLLQVRFTPAKGKAVTKTARITIRRHER